MRLTAWVMALGMLLVHGVEAETAVPVKEVRSSLQQGGFYLGQTVPGAKVRLGGKVQVADGRGMFFVGFDRFAEPEQVVKVCMGKPEACVDRTLLVEPRVWQTQTIKGVSNKHVNPDPVQEAQMAKDSKGITLARSKVTENAVFGGLFARPIAGEVPVSGVYGSRRTYNGEERSWHKGTDFAAPTGTPVLAPADGTVTFARMTFMNGNLIIIDHGQGLFSIYAHLSAFKVGEGEKVAQGQVIGNVGTTGRSTGPHLHWGVYWGQTALDPLLFLGHDRPTKKEAL